MDTPRKWATKRRTSADTGCDRQIETPWDPPQQTKGSGAKRRRAQAKRLVVRFGVVALGTFLAAISLLLLAFWQFADDLNHNVFHALRSTNVTNDLVRFGETMTMSAHLAVYTGQPRWIQMFHDTQPLMDNSLQYVLENFPEFAGEFERITIDAHVQLVSMEQEAFTLVLNGSNVAIAQAYTVLESDEYSSNKNIFEFGVARLMDEVLTLVDAISNHQVVFVVLVLIAACMGLILSDVLLFVFGRVTAHSFADIQEERERLIVANQMVRKASKKEKAKLSIVLRRMLPDFVVDHLRKGKTDLSNSHDSVTVVVVHLSDQNNQESLTAKSVESMLTMYDKIDEATVRYKMHKMRLMGGEYMAVAGLSVPCSAPFEEAREHWTAAAMFASDVREIVHEHSAANQMHVHTQIGISTGPAVSGLVGTSSPAFCLMGKVVEIARYMASTATLGTIQCSNDVAILLSRRKYFDMVQRQVLIEGPEYYLTPSTMSYLLGTPDIDKICGSVWDLTDSWMSPDSQFLQSTRSKSGSLSKNNNLPVISMS